MMKHVCIGLFLCVLGISCGQNNSSVGTTMEEELLNYYKEVKHRDNPLSYNASFYSNGCSFELRVNDDSVFHYYDTGGVGTSFPINPNILKAGLQTFSIKLLPPRLTDGTFAKVLPKDASFKLVIDGNIFKPEGGVEVVGAPFEFVTPTKKGKNESGKTTDIFAAEGLPLAEYSGTFRADVPYTLKGWSESVDLTQEKPKELLKEVLEYNKNIGDAFLKDDYNKIYSLLGNKFKERAQYHYNDSLASIDDFNLYSKLKGLKNKELKSFDKAELKFFGNGKMVGIYDSAGKFKGDPSLKIRFTNEQGRKRVKIIFLHLHRPKPGAPLEAIR